MASLPIGEMHLSMSYHSARHSLARRTGKPLTRKEGITYQPQPTLTTELSIRNETTLYEQHINMPTSDDSDKEQVD